MENTLKIKEIASIEEHVIQVNNLLEIAKAYCEMNFDKSKEVPALISMLEIILEKQTNLMDKLEKILAG